MLVRMVFKQVYVCFIAMLYYGSPVNYHVKIGELICLLGKHGSNNLCCWNLEKWVYWDGGIQVVPCNIRNI